MAAITGLLDMGTMLSFTKYLTYLTLTFRFALLIIILPSVFFLLVRVGV